MRINYNISAMVANGALQKNDNNLSRSIERLSSGLKINHAKDDASGLAMAKRMNAQIRSLSVANQNSNDGMSVIEIAEGALSEVSEMIQRMSELAVKACNGTMSDDDRAMIDDEIKQLKQEVDRIAETTMYNGEVLLNGDFDVKGYTDNPDLKVTTYSDEVRSGDYVINGLDVSYDSATNSITSINSISFGDGFPSGLSISDCEIKGDQILIKGLNDFEMQLQVNAGISTTTPINMDITGIGAMAVQIGTNKGQVLDVRIATINTKTLGLDRVDCKTEANAKEFLAQMQESLAYVNEARGRLGSYENRLEHTISTLNISEENMTGAYSRIMDADMAAEMTDYSTQQVLVQTSTSMLAQANERPSSVLQLLQ